MSLFKGNKANSMRNEGLFALYQSIFPLVHHLIVTYCTFK